MSVSYETIRLFKAGGTPFTPRVHKVVEGQWIDCMRSRTGKSNLFLYWHKVTKNFVLAVWVVDPSQLDGKGLMVELETFAHNPDHYSGAFAGKDIMNETSVACRCEPNDDMLKDFDKKNAAEAYEEMMASEESDLELRDTVRHLKGKARPLYKRVAEALESGRLEYVGTREGGKELAAMREALGGR